MKILAIEFSSRARSVALMVDGRLTGTTTNIGERSVPAFEMIEELLGTRYQREEIECLAIGLGPGSYTGIRAAISLAQGWQLARPIKLLGISSAECLAQDALDKGWIGEVNIAIDAQRGEFYLAKYDIAASGCREIEKLRLATRDEVVARATAGEIVVGPQADKHFAGARELFPTAACLGQLALSRNDFVPGEKLEPIYLRETAYVKASPSSSKAIS